MEGDTPTIFLSKVAVKRGIKFCEFSLIGRVNFLKVSLDSLRDFYKEFWEPMSKII